MGRALSVLEKGLIKLRDPEPLVILRKSPDSGIILVYCILLLLG
jgi:hypothetical protein